MIDFSMEKQWNEEMSKSVRNTKILGSALIIFGVVISFIGKKYGTVLPIGIVSVMAVLLIGSIAVGAILLISLLEKLLKKRDNFFSTLGEVIEIKAGKYKALSFYDKESDVTWIYLLTIRPQDMGLDGFPGLRLTRLKVRGQKAALEIKNHISGLLKDYKDKYYSIDGKELD